MKHAHGRHSYYQRSVSAAYKRQRQARRGNRSADNQRVNHHLYTVNQGEPRSKKISEPVLTVAGYFETSVNDKSAAGKKDYQTEKAKLLTHYRQNKIAFRKWKKPVFLRRIEKPRTEKSAVTERIERLDKLISFILRRRPGVEKSTQPL